MAKEERGDFYFEEDPVFGCFWGAGPEEAGSGLTAGS